MRSYEADSNGGPPFTEPNIVDCLYVTGIGTDVSQNTVIFTGWLEIDDEHAERRIVVRFAMSETAARQFFERLSGLFMRTA